MLDPYVGVWRRETRRERERERECRGLNPCTIALAKERRERERESERERERERARARERESHFGSSSRPRAVRAATPLRPGTKTGARVGGSHLKQVTL